MHTYSSCAVLIFAGCAAVVSADDSAAVVDIGGRRELFVDSALIESMDGAERRLHHPVPQQISVVHDAPWEGAGSAYHSVIHDGDIYRMYYRGSALGVKDGKLKAGKSVYCYAESTDGVTWTKPELGLFEHNGSRQNNIILDGVGCHNFAPFRDTNPNCKLDERFKALGGLHSEGGLFAFKSADGIHWSLLRKEPVITEGAFDSQNLAFWDATAGMYRAYFRTFTEGVTTAKDWSPAGYRAIRTASSADFSSWNNEADLTYKDSPVEHLYTNQVGPYYRAPHILIGFPARYVERGWSESMRALPELEHREQRSKAHLRYGTAITEGLLMASRDGVHFERWNEAFLPPGPERKDTWLYGHQFIAWHAVETKSNLPGAANEISLYACEGSWTGNSNAMRRYTLRLDGFVSLKAPYKGGEVITRPLKFSGNKLSVNFSTSAAGSLRVEVQDKDGKPIPGFAADDCPALFGDSVDRTVTWNAGADISKLAGTPVRLKFVLQDADLYSFQVVK
ncbi:hypothetical protein [Fuerstiella marisgermanici]|uniref:Uncharacterized protein n=1 Tax=Fuerstiella marisgermanici TaxID=1891926 RepID=A0A1P8WIG4_9PLAN|nr:hypothetical protein [Fuerstiella marisgermanici]APZ93851.1 hypothetical protein Fuma_03469 [Fuerstiella marisgermanici]